MQKLKPKKHLGQHFLADENIARKIVSLLDKDFAGPVVEIGPGMGVLTKLLMERFPEVWVVEIDSDAVDHLRERFAGTGLRIFHEDFLKWDFGLLGGMPGQFIGNLPYNVTSPILFRLLEDRTCVQRGVFMVQKEVADRICATAGASGKEGGILTVLTDACFVRKSQFKVPPSVFIPPPKVMSAVFSMEMKPKAEIDFDALKRVVKAAFGQRRKTLRNSIKGLHLEGEVPAAWLDLRAEALTTGQFIEISRMMALRPGTST
ncbi:MAG: ribosomal methyltransferase KsgA/Dim1 family protein [Bacteroidota bacterium]|jgi:16S rRNA (adenine1518-N6/adenine1519-N6)-dimethyltransferase